MSSTPWTLTMTHGAGGYTNPGLGSHSIPYNTSQKAYATANAGYTFTGWTLDGINVGTTSPITVGPYTNGSTHTLNAIFTHATATFTLTLTQSTGGTVSSAKTTYTNGETATVTAVALSGYKFDHWLVDNSRPTAPYDTTNPLIMVMNGNHTVQAAFVVITTSNVADFAVTSDVHVDRGYTTQPDGLNSNTRFRNMVTMTNKLKLGFFSINGDLTDGWTNFTWVTQAYKDYNTIKATSTNPIIEIKGNHDCDNAIYPTLISPINWIKRYGDILVVGIGGVANLATDWMNNGVTYNAATVSFLNSVIASADYKATTYHFLMHHFLPIGASTASHDCVTSGVDALYSHFTMAFCGHATTAGQIYKTRAIPVVRTDHLANGVIGWGFDTVHIDRTSQTITVVHHGLNGSTKTLLTYNPVTRVIAIAAEAIAQEQGVAYGVDMTAANAEQMRGFTGFNDSCFL